MRSTPPLLCAVVLAALLFGCGRRTQEAVGGAQEGPSRGDWVIEWQLSDFEGLNPITTTDAYAQYAFNHLFDAMLRQNWETLEWEPWLVDSLPRITPDHLSYSFHLRPDATFSDGVPLRASDVVFTFKCVKNPFCVEASSQRNYYQMVKDVEAVDTLTVRFTMNEPYFVADVQIGSLNILAKHAFDSSGMSDQFTFADCNAAKRAPAAAQAAMKKFGLWFGSAEAKRDPKVLIGCGKYIFKDWIANDHVTFVRNEHYFRNAGAHSEAWPDRLLFKTINDANAAITALKSGDVDLLGFINPPDNYIHLDTTQGNFKKADFYIPIYYYIGWNERTPFFSDKRVRQAMSLLCDRNTLIDKVMHGLARPIFGSIYFQRRECHPDLKPTEYDPERAKKLLAEAGWTDSDGDGVLDKVIDGEKVKFQFTFLINAGNAVRKTVALIMSENLKKNGIEADVQSLDWSVFLENVKTHKFDATVFGWTLPTDPPDEYQIWHSSQMENKGSNYVCYSNPRVDSLIEKNRVEFDPNKRVALMREFQEILADEQPYTWLWTPKNPTAYNKRFQNVRFYNIRPGYNQEEWYVPSSARRHNAP